MNNKLTEVEKLKYWLDGELTLLHIMFAIILWQLTEGFWPHLAIGLYIFMSSIYMVIRLAYIASIDKNYLKIPKK